TTSSYRTFILICWNPSPTRNYPLSLHDALPIYLHEVAGAVGPDVGHARHAVHLRGDVDQHRLQRRVRLGGAAGHDAGAVQRALRSEEHTSELQSRENLVCRLLLEKKKQTYTIDK